MRIFISGLLLFILVVVTQARFVSWRDINTPKRDHVSRHAEKSAAVYPAPKLNSRVEPPSTKDKVAGISNILKGTVNGISRDTVFEVDETPSSPDQQGSDVEDPEKEILPIEANSYEPNISQKDSESEYRPTTPSAVLQQEEPLSGKSGTQNKPQPDSPTSSGNEMNRGEKNPMSSDTGANQLAPSTDIMTSENSTPILKHDDTQQTPAVRNLTNILQTYGLSEQKDSLKPKEKIKSIFTVPNKKQKVQVHVDYPKPKFLEFINKPLLRVLAPPEHAIESSISPKNETTPDVRGAIVPKNNTESSKGRQVNQTEDKAGSTRESLENWENLKDDLHYEDVDEPKKPELKKEESNQNRDRLFKQNKEDPWLKHLKVADEVEQQNDRIDNLVQQNGIGNLSALEPMQPGQFPNKLADRIIEKNEEIMKLGESLFPKDDNKKKPNTKQIISQYPTPAMTFWKAPVKNSPDNRMDLVKGLGRNDVSSFANSPEIYNAKSMYTPIGSVLSPGVARFDEKSVPPIKKINTLVQDAQSSISKLMEEKNHGLNENIFGGVNSLNNLQLFKKENKAAPVKDQQKQVYQKPTPLQQPTNNVNQNQLLVNPAPSVASKQSQNQNRFAQQPYQAKLPQKVVKPQSKQNQYRAQPSIKPKGPSIAVFDLAFQDPKSRIKTKTSAKATATGNAAALSTSKSDANVNGETSSSYSEKAAGLKQKVQELRHNTQRKQGSRNSYGWGNGQGYGYGKTSFGKGGGHAWAGDNYDTGLWNPGQAGYDTSGNSNHHRPQRQPSGAAGTSSQSEAPNQVTANQQNQPPPSEGASNQASTSNTGAAAAQAPAPEAGNSPGPQDVASAAPPPQSAVPQYQKVKPVAQNLPSKQVKVKETYNPKNTGKINTIDDAADNDEVKPMGKEQETNKKIEQKVDNKLEKPKGNKFAEQATGSGYGTGYGNKESWGQGGGYAWAGKAPPAGAPNPADFLQKPAGMPDFPTQAKGHTTGSGGFQNSGGVQSTGGEQAAQQPASAPGNQQAAATDQQPAPASQSVAPASQSVAPASQSVAPAGPQPSFANPDASTNKGAAPSQETDKAESLPPGGEKSTNGLLPGVGKQPNISQQSQNTKTTNPKNTYSQDDDDSYAKTNAYKNRMTLQKLKTARLTPNEDDYDK